MAGGLGTIIGAFAGEPEFDVKRNVKSDNIADLIAQLQEAEKKAAFQNEWSISDLTKKFFATQGERQQQAKREADVFKSFSDGRMASRLGADETEFARATEGLRDLNLAQIAKGRSRGFLGGDVAGSSYLDRTAFGLQNEAQTRAARDIVDRKRSNLNWLTGNQVNSAGRAGQVEDAALMRILMPGQLQSQEVARRGNFLNLLNSLDKSNTFYGLSKDRTTLDQVGEGLDGVVQLAMEIYGTGAMGGMGGGMGGGGGGGMGSAMGMLGSMGGGGGGKQPDAVRYESMFGGLAN